MNPCGFALLPAYLARRVGNGDESQRGSDAVARALVVGGVTTVGFLIVFGTLGTAISAGARELTGGLPWAGLVIGVLLALAGVAVFAGWRIPLRLPGFRTRASVSGLPGDLLFGIGYGTASLSCTLPIFLAVTGTAVTGSVAASVLGFAAYAVGMGTILTALAVAAAVSRRGLALVLRRVVPYVNRLSGALLLLAGSYVVYYWGFFLLPGSDTRTSGRSLIERGGELSGKAATWLDSSTGQDIASALLGLIVLITAWAVWRRRARRRAGEQLTVGSLPSTPAVNDTIDQGRTHEPTSSKA